MAAALAPALLVLLFASWCGTFGNWSGGLAGGSPAAAAVAGQLLVILAGLYGVAAAPRIGGAAWWDPWRLGRSGRFLPFALLAAVALAWAASPVPRAGRVGVILLPAFLGVPAAVAHAWRDARRRRIGLRAVALAVAAVAVWSLAEWAVGRTARAADPLGHHLLLAAWLALLLPLAVLPWREGGAWRGVAAAAALSGVAALVATRSLAGALALGVEGAIAAVALVVVARREGQRGGRGKLGLAAIAALVLVAAVPLAPRLGKVLAGSDPSARARAVYWQAGWAGVEDRPVTGLGPGATAWTLAAYLRPIPGVNPPGEAVGELHLLPLEVAYELGLPGLALAGALVLVFAARRLRELPTGADPELLLAGLAGLAGGGAAGLATGDWRIGALPGAAAVAAGAALAGGKRREGGEAVPAAHADRRGRLALVPPAVYALAAIALLAPLDRAQHAYDLATVAEPKEAVALLDRAVRLDPAFPLYRARRAWLEMGLETGLETGLEGSRPPAGDRREVAEISREAVRAAEGAAGVAALWLGAGAVTETVADGASPGRAADAFERACALDPLGAFAPFALAELGASPDDSTALTARALAAEPRLAAATLWDERPEVLRRGLRVLATTAGIDAGWRQRMLDGARSLQAAEAPVPGDVGQLATVLDAHEEGSVSLHLFRRLPWRADLMLVRVHRAAARALGELPAATALSGTDPRLFPATCAGPFGPQPVRKTLWKTW